jgi:hypothetical protein
MQWYKKQTYNSNKELIFYLTPQFILENIDTFTPKLNLRNISQFDKFPPKQNLKVTEELIIKSIEYGMMLQIDYKGEEDTYASGHNRVICPLEYGKTKDGKYVIFAYHLKGWSVSTGRYTEKEWRMFRVDRILNIKFLGSFYRNITDYNNKHTNKNFKPIKTADFNEIRNNQHKLLLSNTIDVQDRVIVNQINKIELKNLDSVLNLLSPWENNVLPKKDANIIKITFASTLFGKKKYIAIVGTSIIKNKTFKYDNITFKSLGWFFGNNLPKNINGINKFDLYLYEKMS